MALIDNDWLDIWIMDTKCYIDWYQYANLYDIYIYIYPILAYNGYMGQYRLIDNGSIWLISNQYDTDCG